jgi:sucrose-6F-phosphate phosphohydrolase
MALKRLLLCTDMDRTILPNGNQPEHPAARRCFHAFCQQPEVCLVYVTGRHKALVEQALTDYALPRPDYAITDVGSKIYSYIDGQVQEMSSWEDQIAADWCGQSHAQLRRAFRHLRELTLQDEEKQNRFKLSYYLDLDIDKEVIITQMTAILHDLGVHASLIWSIDEPRRVGLLDVLPQNATKLHGLRFLQQHLEYETEEVVFAGDSGNDLAVLGSEINAVLVANASEEVRALAQKMASHGGHIAALYLARDDTFSLGGNYAAGVLQGIWHFQPEFRTSLIAIGCSR